MNNDTTTPKPAAEWQLRSVYSTRLFALLAVGAVLLAISAHRSEVDKGLADSGRAIVAVVRGKPESSRVARGWLRFLSQAFPLVIASYEPIENPEEFNPDTLPAFAYRDTKYPIKDTMGDVVRYVDAVVKPIGYLTYVGGLLVQTIEIAIWGTILSVLISIPLAYFGAAGYTPNKFSYNVARAICNMNRAIPELIAALVFAVAYGQGAWAGILALGVHTSGFLGKFFADDIENAAKGPQEALASTGANKLKVLRYAVLPQVMPQFLAYGQYILERNVRSATVLGIVGAGGIGVELNERWKQFDYGHVSTILLAIFITVFILEQIAQRVRARLIGE
ncbi:MAG: phosphonate ABC transporter, permease protein PhnE [Planctomycetota bacterium]|nr:MAG: phosphonate ABC transporter, permease protein PhnE [Planctomycetota bacterium]REK44378.1 MAG: phosphonate ABC transporter, permease protein PhnE [Planctomycetota bacterium]